MFHLEDENLFISYCGSFMKTDLPIIKQFRLVDVPDNDVVDYIVCYIYFIVIIL